MKKYFFLTVLFLLAVTGVINAQEISQLRPDSPLPIDKAIVVGKLDNGVTYYIRQNKKPENRAELRIVIKAGSCMEDDDQQGLAHFTEHMCFNGTKNFPKDEIVKFAESCGMKFGGDLNANTGFDRTYYLLTIPLDKPELLAKGMQILEDWAHNVSFDSTEIEKERGVIMEELRLSKGAGERIQKIQLPVILWNSQYAKRLPIGTQEVIKGAPRQRFIDFYKDWYRPDLMAVIAVGDFDVNQVKAMIAKGFGSIKPVANAKPWQSYPIPSHKDIKVSIAKDKELPGSQVSVMFKHEGRDRRTYGAYRQDIMDNLMNQMLSVRIQEASRKAKAAFMFGYAGESEFLADIRAFNIMAVTKNDQILKGSEAVLEEAFRARQHGFTKGELERAKTETMRFIEKAYDERDKVESANYAEECYRYFYENVAMPGIAYEKDLYTKLVPEINLDEINAYIKKITPYENIIITVAAPDKEGVTVPTEAEMLASLSKTYNANYKPYEDISADKPLMDKKPKAGKIVKETKTPNFDIVEMKLSNGIKVKLKKTDFKNDQLLFKAWRLGGTSLATDENFRSADYADGIIGQSGIANFDLNTLEKMMTGKVVGLNPSIGELTEGFDGSASPKDLETMFQMIHLYFTSPRLDEDAFESYMSKVKESVKNSKRTPEGVFNDTVTSTINGYHPRFMPMTEDLIKKIDLKKAYEFYKNTFSDAGDFNFIFVGSFDEKTIKPLIETYIASLPTSKKAHKWNNVGVKYPVGPLKKEVLKGIEPKSTIRLSILGDFVYTPENLMVVNTLGEIMNVRLREVIREDKGGVYGIGGRIRTNQFPTPRYAASVGFSTAPERVEELIEATKGVLKELQDKVVDEKYLKDAKESFKRDYEVGQKENDFWISSIFNSDFNKFDIARLKTINERIDKVTVKDVQAAAKKYLNTEKIIRFVLNPEE